MSKSNDDDYMRDKGNLLLIRNDRDLVQPRVLTWPLSIVVDDIRRRTTTVSYPTVAITPPRASRRLTNDRAPSGVNASEIINE